MQRTPQQVWDATCEDTRWLDDQVAILAEIMHEAYAAGFADGAETIARAVDGHAARLGSQLAVPVAASIPNGILVLARVARELAANPAVVGAAWKRVAGTSLQRSA